MQIGAMNHPGTPLHREVAWMAELKLDFIDLTLEPPAAATWQMKPDQIKTLLRDRRAHRVLSSDRVLVREPASRGGGGAQARGGIFCRAWRQMDERASGWPRAVHRRGDRGTPQYRVAAGAGGVCDAPRCWRHAGK